MGGLVDSVRILDVVNRIHEGPANLSEFTNQFGERIYRYRLGPKM
jgi:hypothetical protein